MNALCAYSNSQWPFLYDLSIFVFVFFCFLMKIFWAQTQKSTLNLAISDSQMDKSQRGHPKRAELPDVNINTGTQNINTERASFKEPTSPFKKNMGISLVLLVLPKVWVGVCRTVLKTLTLFQTKIYDFSYPFSDLTPKICTPFQT